MEKESCEGGGKHFTVLLEEPSNPLITDDETTMPLAFGLFHVPLQAGRLRALARGVVFIFCLLALGACGKKPPQVEAPPNEPIKVYPRVYPDLRTDPSP